MLIMGYSFLWNISHIKIHQNGAVPFAALIYFRKNDFFMKNPVLPIRVQDTSSKYPECKMPKSGIGIYVKSPGFGIYRDFLPSGYPGNFFIKEIGIFLSWDGISRQK